MGIYLIQENEIWVNLFLGSNVLVLIYHLYDLVQFLPVYKWFKKSNYPKGVLTRKISIISSNVYQFNESKNKLVDLIQKRKPDIFITYESDQKWQNAMDTLESDYPHHVKIPLDNTYGMHLYSKIPFAYEKVHHFVSDDIPSIEIEIKVDNEKLRIFAVHPPVPSPTEETTSRERDGELMAIAKYIKINSFDNIIVVGDFNNVAWAKSSKRFRRLTGLNDPRVGRGLIPTFHAKYFFLRIPIDLLFHSTHVIIDDIETAERIDSDHFPMYFTLQISTREEEDSQEQEEQGDEEEMEQDIQEGIEEEGDRD
ncbi:endonuclease/exonuclease/phosphatase family protein [Flavobacteriaceae bacterium Ap0902]|nr:endonuclease/exonuclease/phosphatase family protein [Flavobacteriaceae bacterium Ap0902]